MATDIHTTIRNRRVALPAHDLPGQRFRPYIAAVCTAEVDHATADVRRIAHDTGAHMMFTERRDAGWEQAYFQPHEARAATALNWLSHVQAHESDARGPWARLAYSGAEYRAAWVKRYRYLLRGFIKAARAYVAARTALA
ncbi:MAG TPA: hypothetical protein VFB13_03725 [Reyranella sp.]|jgi:hypothetical protein|nr:hypothetical protein [Reyranella sp.]